MAEGRRDAAGRSGRRRAALPAVPPEVAAVFASCPPDARRYLAALRRLILETASATEGVGPLTECLKWGEPAYLTAATKSGSTVRLGWKAADPAHCALLFNCRTGLVDGFRQQFPGELAFAGNRAIVLPIATRPPAAVLGHCIALALTYHLDRRAVKGRGQGVTRTFP